MDFKDIKVETFKDFTEYFTKTANREGNLARAEIYGYGDGVMIAIGAVLTGGNIKIGKNSFIGLYTYVNGKVNIGENVLIGPRCSIAAGNHKYNAKTGWFSDRSDGDYDNTITIGDGSWLASSVTVTSGVTIGKANLICAGAVVTKDTEDYAIMAGVPAKKIGHIDPESGEYVYYSKKEKRDE